VLGTAGAVLVGFDGRVLVGPGESRHPDDPLVQPAAASRTQATTPIRRIRAFRIGESWHGRM
jgi:hypothetical protein